jgi:putative glutamine amidotransferase
MSLLAHAHKQKIPVMGICRGAQMVNIYFGGTLRDLPKAELDWHHLALLDSSKKAEVEQWIGGTILFALSMHHQASDKIGNNLEIIMEREGIPKLLISHDSQFMAVQFHPEVYVVKNFVDTFPEVIQNKGIYQLFFSKILQHKMHNV